MRLLITRTPVLCRGVRAAALAISLDTYECRLVPGLLQSEGYIRAVYDNSIPPVTDEYLESQVLMRLERQRILQERPNTAFSFIIEEAVLRRQLGGPGVTRDLLDHMIRCAQARNVVLQVMPLKSGRHASLAGPMQLLETPDRQRFAYSEGQKNGRLIYDPNEAAELHQRYATLRSQALTPADSLGLLERLRGEL
ncbi:DUF5753 domain-containing protein [Streptomyces sp. NPDC059009]|uniref:DUF5753 domain-containing protein n=1 Tax=Streptomyces sp. NPDC059009 TaxID=3346694 RepID=UPI0036B0068A